MMKIQVGWVSPQLHAVTLPAGVQLLPLVKHRDERGALSEIFRQSWSAEFKPVQWDFIESRAGVLRGVHVHVKRAEIVILVQGHMCIGLRDLRLGSPTEGVTSLVELYGDKLAALIIPTGIAHGFFFYEPSVYFYGMSEYWDSTDEAGCHWADPMLEIPWPTTSPTISERDAALPPFSELLSSFRSGK